MNEDPRNQRYGGESLRGAAEGIAQGISHPNLPPWAERTNQPDAWAHRAKTMRCQTCMWFVEKASINTLVGDRLGRCRRHAPTISGYPAVFSSDWCGDHKLDENKR